MMLIDGFQAEGITRLIQDSVFMMPHLGVLSTVYPEAAYEVFEKDCLVRLGTCVAPRTKEERKMAIGEELLEVKLGTGEGDLKTASVAYGEVKLLPLKVGESVSAMMTPHKDCDIGSGYGQAHKCTVEGGEAGLIIDCRGRPSWASLSENAEERRKTLTKWFDSVGMYS